MTKNGQDANAFQRADGWCESVCKDLVLSLLSRKPEANVCRATRVCYVSA